MRRFENKICLVTGAASGIGRATAVRLASEGATLALFDLDGDGLAQAAKEITAAHGNRVLHQRVDVTSYEAVEKAVDGAVAELGRIDVCAHIAGLLRTYHTHEMKPSDWDTILQVNLYGTVHVNRACIPHFLKNDRSSATKQRGVIVNMASTAALGKHPWMAAYAAAKGGVISWTRSIFMEYVRRGLRANSVVAGGIATKLHQDFVMPEGGDARLLQGAMPMVDFGTPDEAAGTVAFLASDEARYINGTEVRIDGGALS